MSSHVHTVTISVCVPCAASIQYLCSVLVVCVCVVCSTQCHSASPQPPTLIPLGHVHACPIDCAVPVHGSSTLCSPFAHVQLELLQVNRNCSLLAKDPHITNHKQQLMLERYTLCTHLFICILLCIFTHFVYNYLYSIQDKTCVSVCVCVCVCVSTLCHSGTVRRMDWLSV